MPDFTVPSRASMKFIILQDIPYRTPEGALMQYHGAIWAEELRRRGHKATKMVVGDPATFTPESPLLSLSTIAQRQDSGFWSSQKTDCVLYYANPSKDCVRVVRAIKEGSPTTKVVSRIEAFWSPERRTIRSTCESLARHYIEARHCPTELFDQETRPVFPALLRTIAGEAKRLLHNPAKEYLALAEASDITTFFFPRLVDEAQRWLKNHNRDDLAEQVRWAGYPVRPEFHPAPGGSKVPGSVISVANWRHFKDPELTADAMAIVLRNDPNAIYTVIGQKSERVSNRILAAIPEAASRVHAFDHIDNCKIPELLASSQVLLLCSRREGIPSVLSEALCCGCSLALSTGLAVGAFKDYLAFGDGTQARSRCPSDMADAVLRELEEWRKRSRNCTDENWKRSSVSALCEQMESWVCV